MSNVQLTGISPVLLELTVGCLFEMDTDGVRRSGDEWSAMAESCRAHSSGLAELGAKLRATGESASVSSLDTAQEQLRAAQNENADFCDSMARTCYTSANDAELNNLVVIASGIALLAQLALDALMLAAGAVKAAFDRAATQTFMRATYHQTLRRIIAGGAQEMTLRAGMNPLLKFTLIGATMGAGFGGAVHYSAQAWQRDVLGTRDHIDWDPIIQNAVIGSVAGALGAMTALRVAPVAGRLINRSATTAGRATATVGGTLLIGAAAGVAGGVGGAVTGLAYGAPLTWDALKAAVVTGIGGGIAGTLVQGLGAARTAASHIPSTIDAKPIAPPARTRSHEALVRWAGDMDTATLQHQISERAVAASALVDSFRTGEPPPTVTVMRMAREQQVLVWEHAQRMAADPPLRLPAVRALCQATDGLMNLVGTLPVSHRQWDALHEFPHHLRSLEHLVDRGMLGTSHAARMLDRLLTAPDGDWPRQMDSYLTSRAHATPDTRVAHALRSLSADSAAFVTAANADVPQFAAAARDRLTHLVTAVEYYTTRTRDPSLAVQLISEATGVQARVAARLENRVLPTGALERLRDNLIHVSVLPAGPERVAAMRHIGLDAFGGRNTAVDTALTVITHNLTTAIDVPATALPEVPPVPEPTAGTVDLFAWAEGLDTAQLRAALDARHQTATEMLQRFRGSGELDSSRGSGDIPRQHPCALAREQFALLDELSTRLRFDPPTDPTSDVGLLADAARDIFDLVGTIGIDQPMYDLLHTYLPQHVRYIESLLQSGQPGDRAQALAEIQALARYGGGSTQARTDVMLEQLLMRQPDPELVRALRSLPAEQVAFDRSLHLPRPEFAAAATPYLTDLLTVTQYLTTRSTDFPAAHSMVRMADDAFHRATTLRGGYGDSPIQILRFAFDDLVDADTPDHLRSHESRLDALEFFAVPEYRDHVQNVLTSLATHDVTSTVDFTPAAFAPETAWEPGPLDPALPAPHPNPESSGRHLRNTENTERLAVLAGIPPETLEAAMVADVRTAFSGDIAVRVDTATVSKILTDGRLRNIFENPPPANPHARQLWQEEIDGRIQLEHDAFGYDPELPGNQRPIHGFVVNPHSGYLDQDPLILRGDVDIILTPDVRARTTAVVGELWDVSAIPSPVNDPRAESFAATPDSRGFSTLRPLEGPPPRDYSDGDFRSNTYISAFIHDGVTRDNIAHVIFRRDPPSPELEAALDEAGIEWSLGDDDPRS